jgi:CelD/BcsL family acetyltransferase involved in cellulose biosynthesis
MRLTDFYYLLRPALPSSVRLALRRIHARRLWHRVGGSWPISEAAHRVPQGWPGWPDGKEFAFVLTHDVEGKRGLKRCRALAEMDIALGFRASFNFVPEGEYETPASLRAFLDEHGFEVGVHDLHHDGKLYRSRASFKSDAHRINRYLASWPAVGFRSGFMFHNLGWLHDLDILYDASTFDTDPFEPQPDGVNTIFPFWVPRADGTGYVELPYTLPQDSTLFLLLRETAIDVWKRKLDWVAARGGLALVIVHPDYMSFDGRRSSSEYGAELYEDLLKYVSTRYGSRCWFALPRDVAEHVRQHRPVFPERVAARATASRVRPHSVNGHRRPQEMPIHTFDPLQDSRWQKFIGQHPSASVFHTAAWLRALQKTYHYEPVVFTTSGPTEELKSALLFAKIRSQLTGDRLVSLAFSDHCEPLVADSAELGALCRFVERIQEQERLKYVEIRSAGSDLSGKGGFRRAETFYLHRLDLRPGLDTLLRSFHKDCVQRKIRRAQREALTYEAGRSEPLLQKLYALLRLTRRRHHVPPQPFEWFRNLVACLGEDVCIRVASRGDQPVAGILTLSHEKTMVYKYGGSDANLSHLGGTALLFWRTIQDAKEAGMEELDLGRTDCNNAGLVAFKEHWAAQRSPLTNWRCPAGKPALSAAWNGDLSKWISTRLPDGVLTMAGKFLYRHIG